MKPPFISSSAPRSVCPFRHPFSLFLATVLLVALPFQTARAWGVGHQVITRAALEAVEARAPELLARWAARHRNAYLGKEETIAWYVAHHFCKHPDWVDGPSRTGGEEIEERIRATAFVYAEKNGTFLPPIAYTAPERQEGKGPWPKSYHYFTYQTGELNRAFARKGARWYFERISQAFREGEDVMAAEYFGAFAHAMEDRVSPFHVWDGYGGKREALEDRLADQGLQAPDGSRNEKPANSSLFWGIDGPDMDAAVPGYEPKLLGTTLDEAAEVFTERLFTNRDFAERVYTDAEGFLKAHLAENWRNKAAGAETNKYLSQVARENARLVADVLWTAYTFSKEAESGDAAAQ